MLNRRSGMCPTSALVAVWLAAIVAAAEPAAPSVKLEPAGRAVFQRMEAGAALNWRVTNALAGPVTNLNLSAAAGDFPLTAVCPADSLPGGGVLTAVIPVDTSWKPGTYRVALRLAGAAASGPVAAEAETAMTIVKRPLPQVMPIVLWGPYAWEMDKVKAAGFNHCMFIARVYGQVRRAGAPLAVNTDLLAGVLDNFLSNGIAAVATINPGRYLQADPEYMKLHQRIDRRGQPYRRVNLCGLFPEAQEFCRQAGASVALSCGGHPAFKGADINNEIRDDTELCFHPHDLAAYQEFAGREIPPEAIHKSGLGRKQGPAYVPASGIVPDDDPVLEFYRWFWKTGDGWNDLNARVHAGLKNNGVGPDFWTFTDPAVRAPPLWGSGGGLDAISHWTYTYPDPPRMGLAADEVLAMAEGQPQQRAMKMTQMLWYRRQVAPSNPAVTPAEWEISEPDAAFITTAPDHLREAFWLKISRPVRGIMYYGTGVLWGGGNQQRLTNPETLRVLTELLRDTAAPLGPTLLQVTNAPCDVAMLESFTAGVFGGQWTWGWARGSHGTVYLALQWARLQPRVVYEETILRDGLDGVRVLVLPDCPALPAGVCEQIRAFQRRGGVVVADRLLAPALTPDILIPHRAPGGAPDRNKAGLQALAAQLRADLAPVYAWYTDSTDPDVLVYRRAYKDADYVFAVNDKREYGDYVGQHRKVMERGVACSAELTVRRPGGYVYDLTESRAVNVDAGDGKLSWETRLGPGGGRLYMITARPIAGVDAATAPRPPDDRRVLVQVKVTDVRGMPLDAVIPVEARIYDPAGEEAEFSGYYGARDGELEIELDLAANDRRGEWTAQVRELAAGNKAETKFKY